MRKGSQIPYLYHLLAVSSLVLEYGGNEDQAIAGLLHDVLEDCGAHHEPAIRSRFGDVVAGIVLDCTDGTAESKAAVVTPAEKRAHWQQRKVAYLEHLQDASDTTLLVSGCDKLHNARAIVQDLEDPGVGKDVFNRFTGGVDGTLRYYESINRLLSAREAPMAGTFAAVVDRMHALAGSEERHTLLAD